MSRTLGSFGEDWAAGYLTRAGFRIVARNVRYRSGEIDIVARERDELVFVEVKTRRSRSFGTPEEAITRARFHRLASAIQEFLQVKQLENAAYRVDVIAIEMRSDGRVGDFRHLRGVESP
jgi:putative endonuclease